MKIRLKMEETSEMDLEEEEEGLEEVSIDDED